MQYVIAALPYLLSTARHVLTSAGVYGAVSSDVSDATFWAGLAAAIVGQGYSWLNTRGIGIANKAAVK